MKKEELQSKVIFAGLIVVLIGVLIPLFLIGHYNFESVDDIGYATSAEVVWNETHSLLRVFLRQMSYAFDYWKEWQGTFAAEWFVTSMMGVFNKNAYYMGTYLSLGGFVLSELFFFFVVCKKILGADTTHTGIAAISIICLQILLVPVPSEAFYWFCGAVLYTVVYNESLLLLSFLVLLACNPNRKWKNVILKVGITVLTVLLSGGTYVTLILMLLLYFFFTVGFFVKKEKERFFLLAESILYFAGFLLNVLAPGNQKRLATTDAAQMSAVRAILESVKEAAFYVTGNAIFPCVVLGVMLLPVFWRMVKKKSYRYPLPALVTLLTFGIFAAQFTPTIYTLGITGAGRILNLYRFTYYIWLYGNELYWVGWLSRKRDSIDTQNCYLLPGWLFGGALLLFSLYVWGGSTLTTFSAVQSLHRKEAQTYYAEHLERLAILQDDSVQDVVFHPYTYYPYLLFFGDITSDPEDWVNYTVKTYYGKNSVTLQK